MTFTLDTVNAALDQILAPLPADYDYADRARDIGLNFTPDDSVCEYSHNGTPACLVGMVYTGLTGEIIAEQFPWDAAYQADRDYTDVFSDEANLFLTDVQRWQDRGASWADAVQRARAGDQDYYQTGPLWKS